MTSPNLAPVPEPDPTRLDELAQIARDAHRALLAHKRGIGKQAEIAGAALIEAKDGLNHGEWLPWLRRTGIGARTAQRYMDIARNASCVTHLPGEASLNSMLDVINPEAKKRREHKRRMKELAAKMDRVMEPRRSEADPQPAWMSAAPWSKYGDGLWWPDPREPRAYWCRIALAVNRTCALPDRAPAFPDDIPRQTEERSEYEKRLLATITTSPGRLRQFADWIEAQFIQSDQQDTLDDQPQGGTHE